jgi:hypothetical protein
MTMVKTRIRVAPDGTLSGRVAGLPAGEHEAEITVPHVRDVRSPLDVAGALAIVHEIQAELARLPILDPRSSDEIIGYNEHGHFEE